MGEKVYKLLLVDDEHIVRYGVTKMIPWENYSIDISQANNGQEALKAIETGDYDFVLTDIRMPGMDGLELIEKVYAFNKNIQFAILSGYSDFEYARKAMTYGVRHYLLKPTEEDEIIKVVKDLINEYKTKSKRKKILQEIAMEKLELEENEHSNETVREIIEKVKLHLNNEKLSLNWLAKDVLYRHPDYLGKLFRKEMQVSFSDYCMELRINKAKALLLSSHRNKKICRVAEEVGFGNNPRYFSQVFKKKTGYTPNQYKKFMENK